MVMLRMVILLELCSLVFTFCRGCHVMADIRDIFKWHSQFLNSFSCLLKLKVLLVVNDLI